MNSFKDSQNGEKQPILINIECCQNCALHSWFTHHQEEKYSLYFNEMKLIIEREIDNVRVEKNLIPNNLVKIENKFQQDDQSSYLDLLQNKPIQYPRIGSFEISIFSVTIFSKITSSAWPHFSSVVNILKNIIYEKSQNKVVVYYSVLKNDSSEIQNSRELQTTSYRIPVNQVSNGVGRKQGSASPKPHNGIKMPPLQNINGRSNSPKLRNFISPIDPKVEETQLQPQIFNTSFQRDRVQSPQKTLPPLTNSKVIQKEQLQQSGINLKANFYLSQNQDEKQKSSISFNSQKYRGQSPSHLQNNSILNKNTQQSANDNTKTILLMYFMNRESNQNQEAVGIQSNEANNIDQTLLNERKVNDVQVLNTSKVRFYQIKEKENSLEKENSMDRNSKIQLTKPIIYNKQLDTNKSEQTNYSTQAGGIGAISDMRIKTVKLPHRNIYSNLKKSQSPNRNQNGALPMEQNQNSPLFRNRQISSNIKPLNSKIQLQQLSKDRGKQIKEEGIEDNPNNGQSSQDKFQQKISSPRSITLKINRNITQIEKSSQNSLNSSTSQSKNSQKGKNPEEKRSSFFTQENIKILGQDGSKVQEIQNLNVKNKQDIDLKALYKKVSSDRLENANENNDFLKPTKDNELESEKLTINNLSQIEVIKSDVNSSSSLFSKSENKNKFDNIDENQVNYNDEEKERSYQENDLQENQDSIQNDLNKVQIKNLVVLWLKKIEEKVINQVLNMNKINNSYQQGLNEEQKISIKQSISKIQENHSFLRYSSLINDREPLQELPIQRKLTQFQNS